jgi:3-oxoacyl-[acyl-carrier-protein] synthase-1
VRAWLTAAAGALDETPPRQPSKATALTAVLREVGSQLRVPTPLVVSDLNGERARAFEWMTAFVRGAIPHQSDFRHWNPAESVGDSGAASGAIACVWAATALERGYAREGQALVWGSSDEGAREALLLEAVQ